MDKNNILTANRILLGLVMLIPGLIKLFIMKPEAIIGMLSGLGLPLPTLLAWVLIVSEIVFGVAILAKWKLEYTVIPPAIIIVVAAFTFWVYGPGASSGPNWPQIIAHLALASNYLIWGYALNK